MKTTVNAAYKLPQATQFQPKAENTKSKITANVIAQSTLSLTLGTSTAPCLKDRSSVTFILYQSRFGRLGRLVANLLGFSKTISVQGKTYQVATSSLNSFKYSCDASKVFKNTFEDKVVCYLNQLEDKVEVKSSGNSNTPSPKRTELQQRQSTTNIPRTSTPDTANSEAFEAALEKAFEINRPLNTAPGTCKPLTVEKELESYQPKPMTVQEARKAVEKALDEQNNAIDSFDELDAASKALAKAEMDLNAAEEVQAQKNTIQQVAERAAQAALKNAPVVARPPTKSEVETAEIVIEAEKEAASTAESATEAFSAHKQLEAQNKSAAAIKKAQEKAEQEAQEKARFEALVKKAQKELLADIARLGDKNKASAANNALKQKASSKEANVQQPPTKKRNFSLFGRAKQKLAKAGGKVVKAAKKQGKQALKLAGKAAGSAEDVFEKALGTADKAIGKTMETAAKTLSPAIRKVAKKLVH